VPIAVAGPAEEGFDLLVDLLAEPADVAPGDPLHNGGAHQNIRSSPGTDRAGRDAVHVGLLHDRRDQIR